MSLRMHRSVTQLRRLIMMIIHSHRICLVLYAGVAFSARRELVIMTVAHICRLLRVRPLCVMPARLLRERLLSVLDRHLLGARPNCLEARVRDFQMRAALDSRSPARAHSQPPYASATSGSSYGG